MVRKRQKKSRLAPARKHIKWQFLGLSILSVLCVFMIAVLSRAELRLSGQVLGAGDSGDLARIMELHDCSDVQRVRSEDALRLYHLSCEAYDFLVESNEVDGEWEVVSVERLH